MQVMQYNSFERICQFYEALEDFQILSCIIRIEMSVIPYVYNFTEIITMFKDAMSVSFRSELFTSYI